MDREAKRILAELRPKMAALRSEIETIREGLEEAMQRMESMMDSHSEAWQEGERGQALQEDMDLVSDAITALEEIESAASNLESEA